MFPTIPEDCLKKGETQSSIYIYIYIYADLPVNDIVRLPHRRSGDSQGRETFLAPSADKQTCSQL